MAKRARAGRRPRKRAAPASPPSASKPKRKHFSKQGFKAAWELLTSSGHMIAAWTIESFDALRGLVIDFLLLSVVLFLVQFAAAGIFWAGLDSPQVSAWIVIAIGYFYLLVLGFLAWGYRTLNSAGLLLAVDVLGNVAEFLRTGGVKLDLTKEENKQVLHVQFMGKKEPFVLKFATLQFAGYLLWIAVNCMLNATWYLLLVPGWKFPLFFLVMLYAGITWLVSHKKLDFEWFKWFGTVNVITTFLGGTGYIVLAYYLNHPYPWMAVIAGFLIGFAWSTDKIQPYTVHAAVVGVLLVIATYAMPTPGSTTSLSIDLSDETTIFRFGVLASMVLLLFGMIGLAFRALSRSSKPASSGHGG